MADATKKAATPPVAPNRLKQIANDACNSAIGSAEFYEHAKTAQWNNTIIANILKAVIAESTTEKDSPPKFKFAVNSTIVQHLVPTSQLNKSQGTSTGTSTEEVKKDEPTDTAAANATATDGKPHVGRRGMHSAQGAFWNEETDGMWSYKYDGGESKGMDVVIMLIWIAV